MIKNANKVITENLVVVIQLFKIYFYKLRASALTVERLINAVTGRTLR